KSISHNKGQTMKITLADAIRVHSGLKALDGYTRAVKDGQGERLIIEYFKLTPMLRLAIAMNSHELMRVEEVYAKARNALIKSLSDPGKAQVKADKMQEFLDGDAELLKAEQDIDLTRIKAEELKLDENPIPASTLSALIPILDA